MKQQPPNKQLRLMITNLCQTYNLTIQTLHTTISILMNPNLPQFANQDPDICIAALHLSQKLHQSIQVSISQLCYCTGLSQKSVLSMEEVILKSVGYRIASPLLIDQCFQVAHNWDQFIRNISCINVRFFGDYHYQKIYTNQAHFINLEQKQIDSELLNKQLKKVRNKPTILAYKNLIQICQKLAYHTKMDKLNKKKLSLALVALVIKQTEREEQKFEKMTKNSHFRSIQDSNSSKIISNMPSTLHKSTDFIIADFIYEEYQLNYPKQLTEEIKFVKSNNFSLKDITPQFKNVKNITQRSPLNMNINSISSRTNKSSRTSTKSKIKNKSRGMVKKNIYEFS